MYTLVPLTEITLKMILIQIVVDKGNNFRSHEMVSFLYTLFDFGNFLDHGLSLCELLLSP